MQILFRILLLCCCTLPFSSVAQRLEYGHVLSSSLENRNQEKVGEGGMQYVTGRITLPLSIKRDSLRGMRTWLATINGKYAALDNKGDATWINPKYIINTGVMLTHVRTLAPRWNLIATTGIILNA